MKYLVLLLILLGTSCASFKDKIYPDDSGNSQEIEIERFSGKFSAIPLDHFGDYNPTIVVPKDYYNIIRILSDDSNVADNVLTNTSALLSVFDKSTLLINVLEDNLVKHKYIIQGKLRRNGYFYLSENEMNCLGIPYLFGGCYNRRIRLGIDNKDNLLIQIAEINKGALLFIFFRGYAYNSAFSFKRLTKS